MSIFTEFITIIITWIQGLGWIGVFIGVLLESLIAPIPSPIIPMAGGVILIPTGLTLFESMIQIFLVIGLVGAVAATIGSLLGFSIGYFGGKPIIQKWGKWFAVNWDEIEEWGNKLENSKKGDSLLFFSRAIPIIPMVVMSFAGGAIRYEPKRFFLWTFIGSLPRNFVLGVFGWILGASYGGWANLLDTWESYIVIIIVGAVVVYILIVKIRDKAINKSIEKK